ncbi:Uncharacterised protein [Vibrio mimicus]|nr:Uncharacterised protein [Vibrio mimicus]
MKFFLPFQLEKSMAQRIKIAQQTPQEGLSTRGVSSPIEPRWLRFVVFEFSGYALPAP